MSKGVEVGGPFKESESSGQLGYRKVTEVLKCPA